MERIIVEVDTKIAKAWRLSSAKRKREIGNKLNISLAKELIPFNETDLDRISEYQAFLDSLQKEMKSRGLTQEELDEILADE